MKLAFVIHSEHYATRVLELLNRCGIDYYTRWDKAMGKGHQTEPHLGTGTYAGLNGVFMIGFEDEAPLDALIEEIRAANTQIARRADHIRLMKVPLDQIV